MTYKRVLVEVEIAALMCLLAASTVLAAIAAAQTATAAHSLLNTAAAAKLVFVYTLAIGSLPVILFGAPIYAALSYFRKISWFKLIVIGMAPGLALLFIDQEVGIWASSVGLIVAVLTHLACGKRLNIRLNLNGSSASRL